MHFSIITKALPNVTFFYSRYQRMKYGVELEAVGRGYVAYGAGWLPGAAGNPGRSNGEGPQLFLIRSRSSSEFIWALTSLPSRRLPARSRFS